MSLTSHADARARNRAEWLAFAVAALLAGALLGYFLYAEHREIGDREGARLQVQAKVIGENLERQLEGVNNALAEVRDDLMQWSGKTLSVAPSRRLNVLINVMPGVRTIFVANADGTVLDSSRAELVGANLGEREDFKALRLRANAATLYVSPPFKTPQGVVAINLIRAITSPEGAFAGIAVATLDPEYFNVLVRSVLYAPDMRVALAHGDGKAFVFMPPGEGQAGMDFAKPGSFFSRHRDSGQAATLLTGIANMTGDERMMASRSLSGAGASMDKALVVHVSRSLPAMYASWRAQSLEYGALFALFATAASFGLFFVQRRQRTRDQVADVQEKERRESAERLELALAGADLGLWDRHVPSGKANYSERWSSMLGYRADEIEPHVGTWEELVHPEDLPSVRAAMDAHMQRETPLYEAEHRLRHKDGRWIWILSRGKVVERDAAGAPVRIVGTHMDITERKRVEEEREQYFRFFELSLDPMCIADPFGCFKQVNPAFMRLTGYDESELLARPFLEFVLPEDRQRTAEEMKLQVTVRPTLHFDNRYVRKDGQAIYLVWTAYFDKSDGVTYATARDLTEQKRREEEYRTVIQASTDGFWIADSSGRILDVNEAICRMLGYSRDELLRMSIADIDVDESSEEVALRLRELMRTGNALFQARRRCKDGTVIDVEISVLFVAALGERFFAFLRDITERKQTELALREARKLLEDVGHLSKLGGWKYDCATGAMAWTDELYRIYGVGKDYDPGDIESRRRFYLPEEGELTLGAFWKVVKEGVPYDVERTLVQPSGERIWVRTVATPQIDNGRVVSVMGSVIDITELKQAQSNRDQLEAQLRESQKMEALGTLAGGVAHDFNNIIAAIMGNVELARQDVGPGHLALESLDEIGKASLRAKELVQQILAFGRRQQASRKVISLVPVVEESARLLRTTLPAGVELKVECEPDAPAVLADATQVEQVLLNLCNNAWHAIQTQARAGRIDVRLRAHEREAWPAQSAQVVFASGEMQPGRYACLEVQDNGSGMDRETAARIFEPFFTTKPVDKGTGLGLAVVHGIVQDHGASIEVQSVPGEGSTFCVYFPATQESGPTVPVRAPDAVPAHGEGKHVLFVDDDESIVFLMTRLLERLGYRVSGFTDAREALAAARANPEQFDLAVTDFNMPGMSGLEVARALREIRPGLPVAVASGYITDALREEAPAAGVKELVYKPNTVDELCAVVSRLARELRG